MVRPMAAGTLIGLKESLFIDEDNKLSAFLF